MPFPLIPALAAASTILPPVMTAITNAQNRRNARKDWNAQNAYNHPSQQMQRLKEAGLNPNLVYGGGATTIAQPIKSPDAQVPNIDLQKTPEIMQSFQNVKTSELEYSRIQKAIELQEAQKQNINANTLSTLTGVDVKKADLVSKGIMNQFLPEFQAQKTRALTTGTDIKISQNDMEKLMFPNKIDKVLAEIGNIKARTDLIPTQKRQLELSIKNMQQKMNFFGMTESQKLETGRILQESQLIKNILTGKQITGQDKQNQLLEIKRGFKAAGLSETASSDLIKQVLSIVDFF